MGFSISWLAVRGMSKAELLCRLELTDTGEPDEDNEAPLSAADLATGWAVVFSNDFGFVSRLRLTDALPDSEAIACQVEEHVMFSSASFFSKGRQEWSIAHDAQQGLRHLEIIGAPPKHLSSIRARLMSQLQEDGGDESEVDHIFDVPIDLAEQLTGYRHDRSDLSWGTPSFDAVVSYEAPKAGWLDRLKQAFRPK